MYKIIFAAASLCHCQDNACQAGSNILRQISAMFFKKYHCGVSRKVRKAGKASSFLPFCVAECGTFGLCRTSDFHYKQEITLSVCFFITIFHICFCDNCQFVKIDFSVNPLILFKNQKILHKFNFEKLCNLSFCLSRKDKMHFFHLKTDRINSIIYT